MYKKAKTIFIISGIAIITISVFLALYYCVINKEHKGMIDWWAIMILIVPGIILCVSRIILELNYEDMDDSYKNKSFIKIIWIFIKKIILFLSEILILPFLLIYLIIGSIGSIFIETNKKDFKKLIKKGFKYQKKNRAYFLTRDNTVIKILYGLEDYYISFDNGKNFVRIEESNLGLPYNREQLKRRLHEYKYAHPVDKQRGDAIPPLSYFVDFLDNFIE